MPVDQRRDSRFASDKDYVQRSTLEKLNIIKNNLRHLLKVRGGAKKCNDAKEFISKGGPFLDWEMDKIEKIYESVMKGADLPSCNTHHDKKRKGCGL